MAKNNRFQVIREEGNGLANDVRKVLLDASTGVQYLFAHSGCAGGLCPRNPASPGGEIPRQPASFEIGSRR